MSLILKDGRIINTNGGKDKYRDSFSQDGGKQEKSYGSIFRMQPPWQQWRCMKKAALQQPGF